MVIRLRLCMITSAPPSSPICRGKVHLEGGWGKKGDAPYLCNTPGSAHVSLMLVFAGLDVPVT